MQPLKASDPKALYFIQADKRGARRVRVWERVFRMMVSAISDTHDNIQYIQKVIRMLNKIDPDLVVHCGDFSAPFAASPYKDLDAPMIAVYGNNDAERGLIREKLEQAGKKIPGTFAKVEIDNRKIAVTHGDNIDLLDSLIESQVFDAVIYGHSHQASTRVAGGVLALNPGEVCGYLTGRHTFATLDTASMKAKIIRV